MKYESARRSSMSLQDVKNLVKTGESTWLEFKREIPSPEKIAREIAAFANTKGGTLLIGVDDDKTLVGVESYYEQEFLLDQAANYVCQPPVDYSYEVFPYNQRDIMIVKIEEAEEKPVSVDIEGERLVYIRTGEKSVKASKEVARVLRNETSDKGVTFDFGPNEQKLLRFLNEYERITVKEFANLVNISERRASRILVNLVSAGILRLFHNEKGDFYTSAA